MKKLSSKSILKDLRDGQKIEPGTMIGDYFVDLKDFKKAKEIYDAECFVKDFIEKNGNKAFISERLRNGFIGNLVFTEDGSSFIQSRRGKPFGTVVALKTDNDIIIGMSYIDPEDANSGNNSPVVGLAIALKRAIDGKDAGYKRADERWIKSKARTQVKHFEKRALAYFHPEVYSYSKGTNPVVYEDYDAIHKRRELILGSEKK